MKPTLNGSGPTAFLNPANSIGRGFNLTEFVARAQRRTGRLVRAAYGVGGTHAWFRAAPREHQVEKVREWVEEALQFAAERRCAVAKST